MCKSCFIFVLPRCPGFPGEPIESSAQAVSKAMSLACMQMIYLRLSTSCTITSKLIIFRNTCDTIEYEKHDTYDVDADSAFDDDGPIPTDDEADNLPLAPGGSESESD